MMTKDCVHHWRLPTLHDLVEGTVRPIQVCIKCRLEAPYVSLVFTDFNGSAPDKPKIGIRLSTSRPASWCTSSGCTKKHKTQGLCAKHYTASLKEQKKELVDG